MTFATVDTANLSNLRGPRTVSDAIAGNDRKRAVSRGEAGPGSIWKLGAISAWLRSEAFGLRIPKGRIIAVAVARPEEMPIGPS